MYVVGIDLSGPSGTHNTAVVSFTANVSGLHFIDQQCDGADRSLYSLLERLANEKPVVVGIDAPLSYEPGGGQRPRDAQLRREIVKRGMRAGSVMAPTAPRMVYLTLRGITLAKLFRTLLVRCQVHVVEVHPGASLCLREAEIKDILAFAEDEGRGPEAADRLAVFITKSLRPQGTGTLS